MLYYVNYECYSSIINIQKKEVVQTFLKQPLIKKLNIFLYNYSSNHLPLKYIRYCLHNYPHN